MLVETDEDVLLGLLQNKLTSKEAFRLILKKYQQKLYYFLRRMNLDHEDADELLQDVFLKFWNTTTIGKEEGDPIKIMLYRFAAAYSLAYMKKHPKTTSQGLPASQYLIVILKQREEFDFMEIAQITAMPVMEVRNSFKKGISVLKDKTQH